MSAPRSALSALCSRHQSYHIVLWLYINIPIAIGNRYILYILYSRAFLTVENESEKDGRLQRTVNELWQRYKQLITTNSTTTTTIIIQVLYTRMLYIMRLINEIIYNNESEVG